MSRLRILMPLLLVASCSHTRPPGIEDLAKHESLPQFRLASLRGTRDGARLSAQAMYTDSSSILTIDLSYVVGPTTSLESGIWRWSRTAALEEGSVTAKSVDFLGGQSSGPSVGGVYELVDRAGVARYSVKIPLTEIKQRIEPKPGWMPK